MKKMTLFLSVMLAGTIAYTACSKDATAADVAMDNTVPVAVQKEFNANFPGATNVSWKVKGTYAVADFQYMGTKASGQKYSAWFLMSSGRLNMTETDIFFSELPQAVKDGFEATEYSKAPWVADNEVDVITRPGEAVETLYEIEVEKKENGVETEADLYFTAEGVLAKEVLNSEKDDDFEQFLPETPSGDINAWINANYPGARIVEIERESRGTEVDFIYERNDYEAFFDMGDNWVKTEYDILVSQLPDVVKNAVSAAGYTIADREAEVTVTATLMTYEIEVRKGFQEYDLTLDSAGNILSAVLDD